MTSSGGAAQLPTPRALDDLTPAWLSDALAADVRAVTIDEIGAGSGIFGIIARLTLDHGGDAPDTVIAKLPTAAEANLQVGLALRLYEREARFYADIAADVPARVPRLHAASMEPHAGAFCLLLEDLSDLRVGDQLDGLTEHQAELVTDALAALHARFWDAPQLRTFHWLPALSDPMYLAAVPPIYHGGWPIVRERFADLIEPAASTIGDRVDKQFEEIIDRCSRGPLTLIHTDTRLDNLFFDPNGGDATAIIDWQLALRGRAVSDLAYLLGTSMNVADQDRLYEPLLRRYHDGLIAHGVTDYSLDQCRRDYAEHALYYLCGAVSISATFDTGNERGARLARAFVERQFHHTLVCDAAAALG